MKELSSLVGSWQSTSITGQDQKHVETTVVLDIQQDGLGHFTSNNASEGVYQFDFEILVGTKKLVLLVEDSTQYLYHYEFSNDRLQLKSLASDIVITLERKNP